MRKLKECYHNDIIAFLYSFILYSVILHRLENRTRPISTPSQHRGGGEGGGGGLETVSN